MVIFSCDSGFGLVGSPVLTCLSNRQWSSAPPVCKRTLTSIIIVFIMRIFFKKEICEACPSCDSCCPVLTCPVVTCPIITTCPLVKTAHFNNVTFKLFFFRPSSTNPPTTVSSTDESTPSPVPGISRPILFSDSK